MNHLLRAHLSNLFGFFIIFINLITFQVQGDEEVLIKDKSQTCLFVSLGSVCMPASLTKLFGIRTASFPFDWIVSTDGDRFIEMLDDDFQHFFNVEYLVTDEYFLENIYNTPVNGNVLLNTYYHLEFLHEPGSWKAQYTSTFISFKERYERRIKRFKNLRNYTGKVFFMRCAYSDTDPHRFYRFKENTKINEEMSFRLYHSLKTYFPDLNFTLLVMNPDDNTAAEVEVESLLDELLMIKMSQTSNLERMQIYKQYFDDLIKDKSVLTNDELKE